MLPALMLVLLCTLGIRGTLAAQTGPSPQELGTSVLPPDSPTAGYRMLGPISGFDATTTGAGEAIDKWQSVHFPFRTAAELGLPTTPDGVKPYVRGSGTWWSHVMIVHRPVRDP